MEIELFGDAIKDFEYWKKSGRKDIQRKISNLFKDIKKNPFTGTGKLEALRHDLSGKWSRRINKEHRIIYEVIKDKICVYSLRGHYEK